MSFAYPLSLGAELQSGRTRFRIWAPAATRMRLKLGGDDIRDMQRGEGGVFSCEAECGAGTPYQFVTDDGLVVPDPVSRSQQKDVDGPSVVIDPRAYAWENVHWRGRDWHEIVIYELHVGCFGGAEGGFSGVEARLAELHELGITAIQLMPIADFAGKRNWGYDGVLMYAPDRAYGPPDALKRMIDAAHGLGMCVYLDVVYNHFGPEGNYLNNYAPDFFVADSQSPWGQNIDFRNSRVREFYIENALYWLMEYRFDGLRFDAVHAILEPDWLDEAAIRIRDGIEPGRQVQLMLENEHNQAEFLRIDATAPGYDAQWNDDGHNVLHVLLTGETEGYYRNYSEAPEQKLARCLSEGFVYQGDPYPDHDGRPRGTPSAHLPPTAFILFLQNHDQVGNRALGERLVSLTDTESLRAAITLQLMCPQIPLLFMGEEGGLETPFLFFTDFHGALADAVRDGRRREFAGFKHHSDPALSQKIPDPNALSTYRRSRLATAQDGAGIGHHRDFYRHLLRIRHREIVPGLSGCRSLGAEVLAGGCVWARWRMGDGRSLSILVNLGRRPVTLDRPPAGNLLVASSVQATEALSRNQLAARCTVAYLDTDAETAPTETSRH